MCTCISHLFPLFSLLSLSAFTIEPKRTKKNYLQKCVYIHTHTASYIRIKYIRCRFSRECFFFFFTVFVSTFVILRLNAAIDIVLNDNDIIYLPQKCAGKQTNETRMDKINKQFFSSSNAEWWFGVAEVTQSNEIRKPSNVQAIICAKRLP